MARVLKVPGRSRRISSGVYDETIPGLALEIEDAVDCIKGGAILFLSLMIKFMALLETNFAFLVAP